MLSLKLSQDAALASKLGVGSTKFGIVDVRPRPSTRVHSSLNHSVAFLSVRGYAKRSKSGSQSPKKPAASGSTLISQKTSNPALNGLLNGSHPNQSVAKASGNDKGGKRGQVSIEELYQKKTPIEHILLRPDTYIGSLVKTKQLQWVYHGSKGTIAQRECSYVPGLYKIFDEILVNAADQKTRDPQHLTTIRVDIDVNQGLVSVFNDGAGIPVQIHREENVYLPELLLGHLLTGSNFDDSVAKVTGGRNGYGAKLANIFSDFFCVETFDEHTGLYYKQRWTNHMQDCSKPEIQQVRPTDVRSKTGLSAENAPESEKAISTDSTFYYGASGGFTRITFKPDLALFSMKKLGSDDIVQLMKRRVYDLAACLPGVKVFLDGAILPSNFEHLYSVGGGADLVTTEVNNRWTVGISASPEPSNLTQISFVNCIHTLNGGTHVNYIADQIVKYVIETMKNSRKHKILMAKVTPAQVKNHLILVIKCLVENPAFDSQTKERLMTKSELFGSTCVLDEKFLKDAVAKTGLIDIVASQVEHLQKQQLVRAANTSKKNKLLGIPKLDDANEAGGPRSKECTLIITEGDSAKSLAVSGLSVVGRDLYGVFPVQGKILNVREAATPKVVENKEIKDLIQAIGLNPQRNYANWETDSSTLRYGKVMLMADQDPDGSHIKGLFINFIHHFWPNLLKQDGFLFEFVTPLIKATKKSAIKKQEEELLDPASNASDAPGDDIDSKASKPKKAETLSFFSLAEYEKWKKTVPDVRQWHIKYYKGLGTNTSTEAKEYFSNLKKHVVKFEWKPEADALIDMAFNKKFAAERRTWLLGYDSNAFVDTSKGILDYANFINKELIAFSAYDNLRSIPSVIDGLKPSQRKVLFASFKRKLTAEIKVVQLAGYVSEQAGYHHGEQSLHGTIVNMAQQFVGANNVPLLVPSGQFGTRLQGGKDAASARYIFTRLSRYARLLFPEDDDHLLKYLDDDGFPIEPEYYVPVIPLLLVNGAEGVGTGWSSKVPSYNPLAIIANIRRLLDQSDMLELTPFYRGFRGYTKRNFGRNALPSGAILSQPKNDKNSSNQASTTPSRNNLATSESTTKKSKNSELLSSEVAQEAVTPSKQPQIGVGSSESEIKSEDGVDTSQLPSSWITQGVFTRTSQGQLRVVELPVGRWTNDYKSFLEQLVKEKRYVKEYSEYHTDELVSFLITPTEPEVLDSDKHVIERFKLEDWIHERNMSAFDARGVLQKFSTPLDILKAHFDARMPLYEKRKAWKLSRLSHVVKRLENQTKFTSAVLDGSLVLFNQPKTQVVEKLQQMGIPPLDPTDPESTTSSYAYLLSTPLLHLTREHVEKLQEETSAQQTALSILEGTSPTQLWREDLDKLEAMLLRDPTFSEPPLTPGAKPKIPPLITASSSGGSRSRSSKGTRKSPNANKKPSTSQKTSSEGTENKTLKSETSAEPSIGSPSASSTNPGKAKGGKRRTSNKGKVSGKQVLIKLHPEDHL